MDTPMTNPTLDAQAFVPNHKELNPINPGGWESLPALRYLAPNARNSAAQGDPLRSKGGDLSIPVKANYLPYIQRHFISFGLDFEAVAAPEGYDNTTNNYEFRQIRQTSRPSFVIHNPYNVSIRHDGMATQVDHIVFRINFESMVDASFNGNFNSLNWHNMKIGPGTIAPGAIQVYEGIDRHSTVYSQPGSSESFLEVQHNGDRIIPVAAAIPNNI
jgi:hypothetical protein